MDRCTRCGASFADWKIKPDDCPSCEPEKYAHPGLYHPVRHERIPATHTFKPEFYQAFGEFVPTARRRKELIKKYALEEIGGELKHVQGKDHTPPPQKITTAEKVADTLQRIKYDPELRHKYGLNNENSN